MTHKIHARYMSDTKGYIRGYVSRALLAGALGYPQTPEIERVPHVSRMYPACIPHVSIHIRYISLRMHLRYMYLIMYLVSRMYLDHPCRYMYLACIPNVSCISDTYLVMTHPRYMYRDFVSRCILMYHKMYRDEESKIHVS